MPIVHSSGRPLERTRGMRIWEAQLRFFSPGSPGRLGHPARAGAGFFFPFFLSLFSKTQPHHWTKRMASTQLSHLGPKNLSRTGGLPSLWQTQSDPLPVGKTDHTVGGLACILGLTNPHNQSP